MPTACLMYSARFAYGEPRRLSWNRAVMYAPKPAEKYRHTMNGTGLPASFRWIARFPSTFLLGVLPRGPCSSPSLKSHATPSAGMMPQTSKLTTRESLLMTASTHLQSAPHLCSHFLWLEQAVTNIPSPGYLRPHPRMFAKSFAEPRGICTSAGKHSASSSSVQMNPLPVSFRPSSARESSAFSARNTMKIVNEPVPSPPPEMILGRVFMALASSLAAFSSTRKTSMRPPRVWWLFTTSMMLKNLSW
mmetsp:Transcript_118002/g.334709  ORF Transcript_118002/g.334709 Transcript_118002/m.334709 type:complete len:247 (+) Transcript_118002:700-1440(+)